MRILLGLTLLILVAPLASAEYGGGAFAGVDLPVSGTPYEGAAEPTIGIPWDTDSVFFHEGVTTWRATFEGDVPTWVDVSPDIQRGTNLDPMLHADPDTSRIWAGGLHGACSIMAYSDDDGESWTPAGNICSGTDFDHQSIGSGPAFGAEVGTPDEPSTHHAYYCAQGALISPPEDDGTAATISCARSTDGGETWAPFTKELGPCGGFHGHIRVSRVTGTMAVPVPDCNGDVGMLMMNEEPPTSGQSPALVERTIPESEAWVGGFDPSLQFSRESGWLYYGHASENGIHIALSKDEGETWEPLGAGMDIEADHYLDLGQFHDPPIISGTFADVQVGDDDRVAFSFIGIEATGDPDLDKHLASNAIYSCYDQGEDDDQFSTTAPPKWGEDGYPINQADMVWHYYVATSYDAGDTWSVTRISDDPVQRGGVYDSVTDNSGGCRNLLDFNDMDIDSTGRIHIGYADGCVRDCVTTEDPQPPSGCQPFMGCEDPGTDGYRASEERLFRQTDGNGLFAAYDTAPPSQVAQQNEETGQDTPAPGVVVGLASIGLALVLRRRT